MSEVTAGPGERAGTLGIGSLKVFPPLVMAPMAGLTHIAFRRLLSELGGVGLYYSEMLSARALKHESPGKSRHLRLRGDGRPLCLQIFASEPSQIGPAVERGGLWEPEAWDLNFGCPAPEIVKQGAGSYFLREPEMARAMAKEMRCTVSGPLLFKLRVLETREETAEFMTMLAGEGADALVVHGRRAGERYGRPSRRERMAGLAEGLSIPVIGNGDVSSPRDVERMMEETGCRGVMIGRGALQRPWIFRGAARLFGEELPPMRFRGKSEVYLRLAELLREELEHPRDLYRLREFTAYFARNYKFGHELWKRVNRSKDVPAAAEEARAFFERNGDEDQLEE
jgi:tRNA-dihydrouridine synthase B